MDVHENGIALARAYWSQVVRPILDEAASEVPRSAARIGSGSDVLGLDDAMSRDHDWGLRLQLIVPPGAPPGIQALLTDRLPDEHLGHPTRLTFSGQSAAALTVDVLSLEDLIGSRLGFDPRRGATATDWLSLTGQAALELTAGEVFEDTDGALTSVRDALAWYPDDVWRYTVACDWRRIDQELPLMQRAGHRGDDLGSRVIAARLVDVAVHLGFLLCRRWAPYPKWRGTVFGSLPLPVQVGRDLRGVLTADDWRVRRDHLAAALEGLAGHHRRVGLPVTLPACVPFWDRPYLHVEQGLADRLLADVEDPDVRRLPAGLGSIEQRTDNVDLLTHAGRRRDVVDRPAP